VKPFSNQVLSRPSCEAPKDAVDLEKRMSTIDAITLAIGASTQYSSNQCYMARALAISKDIESRIPEPRLASLYSIKTSWRFKPTVAMKLQT